MARARKKAPEAKSTQAAAPDAPVMPAGAPDVFDHAIAAQPQPPAESAPEPEPPATGFAARATRPDPFGEVAIALSGDPDGPKVRLFRSQRFQQLAIQFDDKPDEDIRHRLRAAGWTWRSAEGAWTKQLGDRPGDAHRQAQDLFEGLAADIRRANGLEPTPRPARGR